MAVSSASLLRNYGAQEILRIAVMQQKCFVLIGPIGPNNMGSYSAVITHPLTGPCLCCQISNLRQYRAAVALKVIVGEMPVVQPVAKPFWSPLLERYWPQAEHLSNGLGSHV